MSKYPELDDQAWLTEHYINQGLSTKQMAKMAGVKTPNSVRQGLIRAGIAVRSIRQGVTHNRKDDGFVYDPSVIAGCLLGDGCLTSRKEWYSWPEFQKRNKCHDHVLFVAGALNLNQDRVKRKTEKFLGQPYELSILKTLTHQCLIADREKWYPNRKKVVPQDIVLDPVSLLHWFLDDGSAYMRNHGYREVVITLSPQSFTYEDNLLLCYALNRDLGLEFRTEAIKDGTGTRLRLPQSQADKFYSIIGPCPVPSMAYKWK